MNEFDIIKEFFSKQSFARRDVILGVGDDAAIVEVPINQQLAITTDTLIAGVHFPQHTAAYDIGYKSLAVNLSDLAAMGATPAWITLALSLPDANEKWLSEFRCGLFDLAQRYNTQLIGGDLTHGALTITIEAFGFVEKNQAIKRSGAKPGDLIYVTNTIGDAALGLRILQNNITVPETYKDYLVSRLNRPEPRIEMGKQLRNMATAAIDISDGLAVDLQHILEQSKVGAKINVDSLPLSNELSRSVTQEQAIELALMGGDDYELCFTVSKEREVKIPATCIGVITEELELDLQFDDGRPYTGSISGYKHF